jgi:transposase
MYENKKKQVKELIYKNIKVSEIVKITGIPFQTIYKWKKEF